MNGRPDVTPVILGPCNAEAATGWPWRFVKERARELGVPVLGAGKKLGVSATAFLAALERAHSAPSNALGISDEASAESVRALIGKRRVDVR